MPQLTPPPRPPSARSTPPPRPPVRAPPRTSPRVPRSPPHPRSTTRARAPTITIPPPPAHPPILPSTFLATATVSPVCLVSSSALSKSTSTSTSTLPSASNTSSKPRPPRSPRTPRTPRTPRSPPSASTNLFTPSPRSPRIPTPARNPPSPRPQNLPWPSSVRPRPPASPVPRPAPTRTSPRCPPVPSASSPPTTSPPRLTPLHPRPRANSPFNPSSATQRSPPRHHPTTQITRPTTTTTTTIDSSPSSSPPPSPRQPPSIPTTATTGLRHSPHSHLLHTSTPSSPRSPRRAPGSSNEPRLSTGPLSSRTMDRIRCPTRVDFINAVNNGLPPATSSSSIVSPSPQRVVRRARRTESVGSTLVFRTSHLTDDDDGGSGMSHGDDNAGGRVGNTGGTSDTNGANGDGNMSTTTEDDDVNSNGMRNSSTTVSHVDANDSSDDEGVPAHLNRCVLDAMDRIAECDELRAVVKWLDALRARAGFVQRLSDVDLGNGIALLQVMSVVAIDTFPQRQDGSPDVRIERDLDEGGIAAGNNVKVLREALTRFEWRNAPGGQRLHGVAFDKVDIWGLAGFVALAGVTGTKAGEVVDGMLEMDEWIQERLTDVVTRGLQELGIVMENRDDEDSLLGERRRRQRAEREVVRLQREVQMWRDKTERLEKVVQCERKRVDELRGEVNRYRGNMNTMGNGTVGAAGTGSGNRRRRVLGEANETGGRTVDDGAPATKVMASGGGRRRRVLTSVRD